MIENADLKKKLAEVEKLVLTGKYTINEAREAAGLQRIEDVVMDMHLIASRSNHKDQDLEDR